jgi:hypothetical protein
LSKKKKRSNITIPYSDHDPTVINITSMLFIIILPFIPLIIPPFSFVSFHYLIFQILCLGWFEKS